MHMSDALLSPTVGLTMCAVSAGALAVSAARVQRSQLTRQKLPMMAVGGAFVFAAQMINFTIPGTGSSGHIGGGILLAALLGGGPDREYVVEQNLNNTLSIIVDGWKYIEPSNKMRINRQTDTELGNDPMRQLYNLREDVGERHNLAGQYPAKADSLHNKLENIKRR